MDSYHLSIVKIEGLAENPGSYLYIYSGLNILRVLTLESFDIDPVPISKGVLRFLVEDSHTSSLQASLTFKSDIFTRYGFHWLPLFARPGETLTEIPIEVNLPRVLIDIQSNVLSPVQEITEESETFEEASENSLTEDLQSLRTKNVEMSVRILELEELLNSQKMSFDEEIEGLKGEFVQLNKVYLETLEKWKRGEGLVCLLEEEIRGRRSKVEEYGGLVKGLSEQVQRLSREVDETKEREESILRMLQAKDLEIFYLRSEKKVKLDVVFESCFGVLGTFNQIRDGLVIEAEQGIDVSPFKQVKKKDNNLILHTQNTISAEPDYRPSFNHPDKEMLVKKLYEAELLISNFKLKCLEELDSKVRKFLCNKKLENFASVCNELVYNIANTKVTVFTKGEALHCKVGGVVKKLDSFIKNQCYQDIENFRKQQRSSKSNQRIRTCNEVEKIGTGAIHKTFDGDNRIMTVNKNLKKRPTSPGQLLFLSPNVKSTKLR